MKALLLIGLATYIAFCGTLYFAGNGKDFNDPFVQEPRRYYCPDGLHPSGEGYGIWFSTLMAQVPLRHFIPGGGSD